MERVTKYFATDGGYPEYVGPGNLRVVGQWVTADIQVDPYSLLEVLVLVAEAQRNPKAGVEEFGGNAHYAEISPGGVQIQNEYVEHVRGDFPLDQVADVLADFWEYCKSVNPERTRESYVRYVAEHGHDPIPGFS
ncbi:hypothetical protein ACH4VR_40610 [Streptomyces sp. NPDC020883]|uniref:hypothetical protein n=1 Tax=Streptomyces sp. NPDC020883 TaxID=3365099 RepID=UPI00378D6D25